MASSLDILSQVALGTTTNVDTKKKKTKRKNTSQDSSVKKQRTKVALEPVEEGDESVEEKDDKIYKKYLKKLSKLSVDEWKQVSRAVNEHRKKRQEEGKSSAKALIEKGDIVEITEGGRKEYKTGRVISCRGPKNAKIMLDNKTTLMINYSFLKKITS
jgi:hypothetical protein